MMSNNNFRFAIVVSRWNNFITEKLLEGALARLVELNIPEENVKTFWVPGAVEIPIVTQRLAQTRKYNAIIVFGAVIRGETAHFEYVCQMVTTGCQRVSLDENMPVIFGVLTTYTKEQALDRVGGKTGHMGIEAIDTAIETVKCLQNVDAL